jgi:phenylalanyl-tRNA synthetase beta chain
MSREQEYLRTTLRAGLLSVLVRNERYQEDGIRLFEIGKVFLPRKEDLPQEKEMLCAVMSGLQHRSFWRGKGEPSDFFVAKGVVETILFRLGVVASFSAGEDGSLCPGRCANIIVGNEEVGVIGELHPEAVEALELYQTAYLVEIDLDKLPFGAISRKYQQIPRYPSTSRDIALLVNEQITYEQIYTIIRGFPLVNSVALFDLYVGEQVPAGKKSLAFRVVYQSSEHTLTDEEVDEVQHKILERLGQELGANLRD